MPKIIHVARFTTPVQIKNLLNKSRPDFTQTEDSQGDTPKIKRVIPENLQKVLDEKKEHSRMLIRTINNILIDSSQPLTISEIREQLKRIVDHEYHDTHVRLLVDTLVKEGLVSKRKETNEERKIRSAGASISSVAAHLYWAPAEEEIPARTITEAVSGVVLTSKPKQPRIKKFSPPKADQSVNIDDSKVVNQLVEMIVKQRTADLEDKLKKAEDELSRLRSFLKSAIQE